MINRVEGTSAYQPQDRKIVPFPQEKVYYKTATRRDSVEDILVKIDREVEKEQRQQELEFRQRRRERQIRARQRKQKELITKFAAGLTALSIAAGVAVTKLMPKDTPSEDITISITEEIPSDDIIDEAPFVINEREKTEAEAEAQRKAYIKETAEAIMEANPELKSVYSDLKSAADTFTSHLGEDGLQLIKDRVKEIGNGQVSALDAVKILFIESSGRIYDKNGEYLRSSCNALGPWQLTEDNVKDLNRNFGLAGTCNEVDPMNPYDNLDGFIYNFRFLTNKFSKKIAENGSVETGSNLKDAIIWGYHDGAYATKVSENAKDYIEKFHRLSKIDMYPELVDYLLQS